MERGSIRVFHQKTRGVAKLFLGTYITQRKANNFSQMNGRIAKWCRDRGYKRVRGKNVFSRHTVGLGGAYVFIEEDHVRVRVKDLGIEGNVRDLPTLRELLELIDRSDEIVEVGH